MKLHTSELVVNLADVFAGSRRSRLKWDSGATNDHNGGDRSQRYRGSIDTKPPRTSSATTAIPTLAASSTMPIMRLTAPRHRTNVTERRCTQTKVCQAPLRSRHPERRSPCGPFCPPLRSSCGLNPREHPRTPASSAVAIPALSEPFARIRGYSRFLKAIGANG
jgi:hypothetical protein